MTTISSQEVITRQGLHEILSPDDIEELCEIFQHAKNNKFEPQELRELLGTYNIFFDDDQFKILFLKINTNRDNQCDWDELVSHMLLGFRTDDPSGQKETLNLPIEGLPTVRKAIHRYPVVRIRLCPTVMPDRSVNNTTGSYITTSKDGTVIYWTQDFQLQRTEKSKNPNLKVSKTWVLDCIPLPDVNIVCTSSIERDLRFYDTTANNFHIRIIISRLPFAVYSMAYWFGETEHIDCRLILGDAGGNVWLLEFTPELRGPFQSKPGTALLQMTWANLLHGKLPLMRVTEFHRVHNDIVRQVEYCSNLNAIFSAAECRDVCVGHTPAPGLVISDLGVQRTQTIFRMTKGVTCFAFDRGNTVIATGGPDCMLRLWNHIMARKPVAILPGHHCGIVFICLQDDGQKVYTIDRSKLVKVWETSEQNLLQTFNLFSTAITDRTAITCFYNDNTRDLTIGNMKFASVKCCPLLKLDKTDGYTHSRPLSVILYNDLFKSVVTCGLDSYIIVWNLWTGKRETFIKEAHTRMAHGGMLRLEITAACFDPKQQLLLTGARDGTLKIWNFNNGICVRNLAIEYMCEVTQVFWFNERILAVGWNKHVIEFSDTDENELGNSGKKWDICHVEDVLAAAAHPPQSLITSSYGGELVFWKLETGQPYRRYDVDTPAARIKIKYEGQKPSVAPASKYSASKSRGLLYLRRSYRAPSRIWSKERLNAEDMPTIYRTNKVKVLAAAARQRQVSIVQLPSSAAGNNKTAVHAMICLTTRPASPEYGTVFVALENGVIQVFSNHYLGGYIDCFNAIHMAGDCVTSMAVDKTDRYLITGTALGYIKTWLVCNYCVPESQIIHINWPELRLQFPFLIRSFFEGRAKRTFRNEKELKLCNSYKAHMLSITSVAYLNESRIVLSASADATARIWTLGGQYIGTLGSPIPWEELVPSELVRENYPFRIPPDIKRCASSTTLKVLKGGHTEDPMSILLAQQKHKDRELKVKVREGQPLLTYGQSVGEPILGENLKLPDIEKVRAKPMLENQLTYIPIYSHLDYTPAKIVTKLVTPDLLKKCKMISFMGKKRN